MAKSFTSVVSVPAATLTELAEFDANRQHLWVQTRTGTDVQIIVDASPADTQGVELAVGDGWDMGKMTESVSAYSALGGSVTVASKGNPQTPS